MLNVFFMNDMFFIKYTIPMTAINRTTVTMTCVMLLYIGISFIIFCHGTRISSIVWMHKISKVNLPIEQNIVVALLFFVSHIESK